MILRPRTTTSEAGDLDVAVDALRRRHRIPGLSLAVVTADRVLHAAGYGTADLASGRPATATTAYLWFSMTKVVTATTAVRLSEEGRLDLDAPVGQYVPDLPSPAAARTTARALLTHTAGLSNPLPVRWAHAADAPAPDGRELLDRVLRRRGAVRHGTTRSARYSNVGYLLLGEVIAAAAGVPVERAVHDAVLTPAGMTRTGFRLPPTGDAATGYVRAPRVLDPVLDRLLPAGVPGARHGRYRALNPFYVDGPAYGGLVGDVADVGRFLRLHLGDGEVDGRQVLSATGARAMREIVHPGRPFDHGTGWFRRPGPGAQEWVEHLGTGAGFWNAMRLYPRHGVGLAVLACTTRAYDVDALFRTVLELTGRRHGLS